MGRKKRNLYRIKIGGLIVTKSLYTDWAHDKTDKQIVLAILLGMKYFGTYNAVNEDKQRFEVKALRKHEVTE